MAGLGALTFSMHATSAAVASGKAPLQSAHSDTADSPLLSRRLPFQQNRKTEGASL